MRFCKKCKNKIPTKFKIKGILRNLSNRMYCLDCSPFGKHNTKYLENYTFVNSTKIICRICNTEFDYSNDIGHRNGICSACHHNEKRKNNKKKCVKYKDNKCIYCGYCKCLRSLDFHHKNPKEKLFNIAEGYLFPWKILKAELDKCDLICKNCHGELHEHEYSQKINKILTQKERPSKEWLEQLVWMMPISFIAEIYETTRLVVKNWIKKYKIVTPNPNFWQQNWSSI